MLKVLLLLLYLGYFSETSRIQTNNQLFTYAIPDKRPLKQALGYIEDTYFNFTELTDKYKYPSEEHTVITADGYVLTIFRILPKCDTVRGLPVVLVHGIIDSSDAWILAGPRIGLGYILANNCYDVWAMNNRGNRYARKHIRLNPNEDVMFWNFSFDEIGRFDVPAVIDYVLSVTKNSKVYYVGHSQGTTDFFVMTSLLPAYNNKIRLSIHLGPVAGMRHITSVIPKLISQGTDGVKSLLDSIGYQELLALHQLEHVVLEKLCQFAPVPVCGTILALATGYKQNTISPRTLSIAFGHLLVGVSAKTLAHFGQMIVNKKFRRYDEGLEGNIKRYASRRPPLYNLSRVTAPVVLVGGQSDWLSTLKDLDELSSKLPNVVQKYVVPDPTWSHNNHLWGDDAPKYVFQKVLEFFNDYNDT